MKQVIAAVLMMFAANSLFAAPDRVAERVVLEFDGKKTVEQAVFEQTLVINPDELKSLVEAAKKTKGFPVGRKPTGTKTVELLIPANYLVEAMAMYEEIDLSGHTLVLFQLYEKKRIELFRTKVAVGARGKETPTGDFCLKRVVFRPRYFPIRKKNAKKPPPPVKPGPKNPYGLWMAEILQVTPEPAGYEVHPAGRITQNGIRQHSTNRPSSIGTDASLGCIRMYPRDAEHYFPFLLRFTPHREAKKVYRGEAVYPFKAGHLVYVKIYRSKPVVKAKHHKVRKKKLHLKAKQSVVG